MFPSSVAAILGSGVLFKRHCVQLLYANAGICVQGWARPRRSARQATTKEALPAGLGVSPLLPSGLLGGDSGPGTEGGG